MHCKMPKTTILIEKSKICLPQSGQMEDEDQLFPMDKYLVRS